MSSTVDSVKLRPEQGNYRWGDSITLGAKESFLRCRKGPADEFYGSLMQERNQSRESIAFKKLGNAERLPVFTFKASRQSTLDVTVDEETQTVDKNPMMHFEHGLNYTMRPRCHKLSIPSSIYSDDEENDESDESIDEMICSEIAEACEEELFGRRPVFDNRWSCGSEEQSSNESKFERYESLRPSVTKNSSAPTLLGSYKTADIDSAGLRFQLKQETGKLRAEALENGTTRISHNHNHNNNNDNNNNNGNNSSKSLIDSHPPGEESINNSYNGNTINNKKDKYWTTNMDMESKRVSEKIGRELQTVRRFAVDPRGTRSKPLSAKVKRICSEDEFQSERLEILIQEKISKAPPLVKRVNINSVSSLSAHTGLSDYLESVRKSHLGYYEAALKSLSNDIFRETLLAAKEKTDEIWSENEKSEFLI